MKKSQVCAFVLFILMSLSGCGNNDTEIPELLEPVDVKMDVARAEMGEICELGTYSGEVVPYVEEVYFSVDGYLDQMLVSVGDTVQEGDVLAVLDEEQLMEQIESLEEEIDYIVTMGEYSDKKAELDIEIAGKELAALLESRAQNCTEKELEIQKLKLQLEQTQELRSLELEEKQSALERLQEKSEKNQLTAPFDGTVIYVGEVKKGEQLEAYAPVIYLADDSRLFLSAEYIPEAELKSADRLFAQIMDKEYEISYVPYDESEYIAMVLYGEELDAQFSFDESDDQIRSGQFAAVVVVDSYRENVLTIPANALYRDGSERYVYKQEGDQRIRCDVTTGVITDTKAEIVEGLQEGDMVYVKN